jgi:hypothetical protein
MAGSDPRDLQSYIKASSDNRKLFLTKENLEDAFCKRYDLNVDQERAKYYSSDGSL